MSDNSRRNRTLVWTFFAVLVVLHHDWWFWDDARLVFGFVPIGLAYHMLISILAGCLWGWAAWKAWPKELDEDAVSDGTGTSPVLQGGHA